MSNTLLPFLEICAMQGQLVLVEAPSLPDIHEKVVSCTGAYKHGDNRVVILDGEEYSQVLFVDGTIRLRKF